ncbi:MAG: ribosomal L7Ae/L30e/S12e/Gadd45 family protein [Oscillospiraceae bacterium]|jgi:ribosomal protein L7Ae-like RNA K-turn-binding protein|nr:ribosomal L7Ae/L30e/S12e/Gadd45 family protein [Oscillospiraceae bacterium]
MADLLGLLGMARKAGRLALGEAAVEQTVRRGTATLLLIASDAAPNARRRAERWAAAAHVELLALPQTKAQFGARMGRNAAALAALTDAGFTQATKQLTMKSNVVPAPAIPCEAKD